MEAELWIVKGRWHSIKRALEFAQSFVTRVTRDLFSHSLDSAEAIYEEMGV